jgi:hypothetical protein
MIILATIIFSIFLFMMISNTHKADVYIAFIKGFMVGALYNKDEDEITIQLCLGMLTFTAIWYVD